MNRELRVNGVLKPKAARVLELIARKWSIKRISVLLGVSPAYVSYVKHTVFHCKKRYGVPLKFYKEETDGGK